MPSDNELNNALLAAELPNARLLDTAYIHWLYDENPYGPAVQRNADDDGQRVAHYGMIPQRYRGPDGVVPAGFSLNAVVQTGAQRKGWFRQLGPEVYEGAREAGWQFATGVCNDKSIGTVIKYLGWKTPGPLPVRVCPPGLRAGDVESHAVDGAFFAGPFERLAAGLDETPVRTWTNSYTPEYLRWRLAYSARVVRGAREQRARRCEHHRQAVRSPGGGDPEASPAAGRSGPLRADAIVAAACRFHRAPYAVYAGFNEHVKVRGIQPPRRFQPSPLHLILRSLSDIIDQDALSIDTFEFLDMDAY